MTGLKLSVDKRCLLHILKYSRAHEDSWDVPHALTQEGISEALDILLNNVSRAMKGLRAEGLVDERLAHVKGLRRRRKAYFLTDKGMAQATEVRDAVRPEKVRYIDKDGKVVDLTAEEVIGRFRLESGVTIAATDVVETVRRSEVFDAAKVHASMRVEEEVVGEDRRKAFVDLTDSAPRLGVFVGREAVVAGIEGHIEGEGPPIIVVIGMAGIGKTSVALKVMDDLRGTRHMLYHRFHEWDSLQNVANTLIDLLDRIGKGQRTAISSRTPDVNDLAMVVARLSTQPVLLVLDDVHKAGREVTPLFRIMVELARQFSGLRVLMLSRKVPPFYTRREVNVTKVLEEVHLDGLDIDETRAFLGEEYNDEAIERMFDISRGVPLFLEIMTSVENANSIADIRRFVEEEVFSELGERERRALEGLSVHRYPVPQEAVLSGGTTFDDLSALCRRALVLELPHRRFEAHDLVKELSYQRMAPEDRVGYHRRAADFYLSVPDVMAPLESIYYTKELAMLEAVYHTLMADEAEEAARLLLRVGPDMLRHGYTEVLGLLASFDVSSLAPATAADILLLRGDAAALEEDWQKALGYYQQALEAKRDQGADKGTLAAIHGTIGRVQMQFERWEETIRSHEDALRMFEEEGDDRGMAKELINLGIVHRNRREWRRAAERYERARGLLEGLGDSMGLVVLHNNLALLKRAAGDLKGAEAEVEAALDLADRADDQLGRAIVLFTRGQMRMAVGRTDTGRKDMEEAAETFRRKGSHDSAIEVLLELGDVLLEQGRTVPALRYYLKALDVYQFKTGSTLSFFRRRVVKEDPEALGSIYDRLSAACRAKGDAQGCLDYDAKAMRAYEDGGNLSAAARKALDMGLAHQEAGDLERAVSCMELALERIAGTDDLKGMVAINLNLARAREASGDIGGAIRNLARVTSLARDIGDRDLEATAKGMASRLRGGTEGRPTTRKGDGRRKGKGRGGRGGG